MENLWQTLFEQSSLWIPKIIGVIVVFLIFFIVAKILKMFARTSSVSLVVLGLITALGTIGINVSALVAGLGLTGFALGFALKDTISNLLSGVLILLYRPFEMGNRIKILGYEGTVIAIDLRYTELDSEGNKVLIPNSKLFTDPITVIKPGKIS